MTETINTTVDILGKPYIIRCVEKDVDALQQAATFLNEKMLEVQESGKVINLERIAIITALNIAHQLLQISAQKEDWQDLINDKIVKLDKKLEQAMHSEKQTELVYSAE